MDKLISLASRLFFVVAFGLLGLAVLERAARFTGYTILRGTFEPGRLLEYAAILLVFVMAVQLRQIRQAMQPR